VLELGPWKANLGLDLKVDMMPKGNGKTVFFVGLGTNGSR